MRYGLRTLLILLAIGPPMLWVGWTKYEAWRAEQEQRAELFRVKLDILIWMDDLAGVKFDTATEPNP